MSTRQLETLLQMVHEIADPAQAIQAKAMEIAEGGKVSAPTMTALINLHAALNQAFFEANQIMKNRKLDEYESQRDRSL
ncbi:hypothetical protein E0J20_09080 [Rhizobium leguminosarum bv. viciae]|nr:hypothetical protein E0J20_09080 [Rhizobium leguminosarum bv. viciae]